MAYERQKKQLSERPTDIVVATPGRLLDYMRGKEINLSKIEVLVIDEADRMLDMGFIPDVQRIVQGTPPKAERQTMFFSATLTPEVTRLACQWTRDAMLVDIEPEQVAVNTINQVVYITTTDEKFPLLFNLITTQNLERVIVFTNRRDQARRLTDKLNRYNISSSLLSGEVAQNQRIKTLEDFRSGRIRILVATDVAARGLHVEGVSHVVNYHLPHDAEDYVHRIGRTGRAGASGISVSFACEEDSFYIPAIEKFLGHEIHCIHPEDELIKDPPPPPPAAKSETKPRPPRKRTPASQSRRSGSSTRRSPKKEADPV
jgi:ATP-dependent RNA helicase RhlB